ncbi:MAG: YbjN domain-containing protein [bacterium]|nr:YbjN domain-containing protein [bacterium]
MKRALLIVLIVGFTSVSLAWEREDTHPLSETELAELSYAADLTADLLVFMDDAGINYTVDPEYPGRWAVPYEGDNSDWTVVVSVGAKYTVFVIEIIKMPDDSGIALYEWLMDLNFSMNQAKFGTEDGRLYFNVDIPTRVLDRVEYFETVNSMVNYVDGVYPELLDRANNDFTENNNE